jgi:hypothetical protein
MNTNNFSKTIEPEVAKSMCTALFNGRPLNVDSLTSLGQVAFQAIAASGPHGSYCLIATKTAAVELPSG